MSSLEVFDPAPLLLPIAGDLPCGVSVEFTPEYDTIRLARQSGDSGLPAGMWEREVRRIDWADLQRQCSEMLTLRSKDLQVAAWLQEALVHQFGIAGMARGMAFFATFTETFWEGAHPQLEQVDAALRMTPINWLLRACSGWLASGPLTVQNAGVEGVDDVLLLHDAYTRIDADLVRLDTFLTEKVADFAPSVEDLRKVLQERRAPLARQMAPASDMTEAKLSARSASMNRDDAYEQLDAIAQFLNRTEPHSPVPLVLLGLVSWRNATFADLLQRLPQGGPSVYELLKLFDSSKMNS